MKYSTLFPVLLTLVFAATLPALAQDGPPPHDGGREERLDGRRPNLLAELGLSREQVRQIQRIYQERRPVMMEAQRRMRVANRELDMAIYRDSVSDEEFQARLKEFQVAQADLARLRFENELAVRKILTAEQLVRFRDMRRKFAEEPQGDLPNRRMRPNGQGPPPGGDRPLRRNPSNE